MMKPALFFSLMLLCTCLPAEEKSMSGFCFPPDTSLVAVRRSLSTFLLPGEILQERPSLHCLELPLSPRRKNFFTTYLSKHFTLTDSYGGDKESEMQQDPPLPCHAVVTQESRAEGQTNQASADPWKREVKIQEQNSKNSSTTTMNLLLQSGRPGKLLMDGESVEITCVVLLNDRFQVDVHLIKDVKPENSTSQQLTTSLQVVRNQKINLGDIVTELDKRDRELSLGRGVDHQKDTGQKTFHASLMIK